MSHHLKSLKICPALSPGIMMMMMMILLGKKYENFGKVFAPPGKISAGAPVTKVSGLGVVG